MIMILLIFNDDDLLIAMHDDLGWWLVIGIDMLIEWWLLVIDYDHDWLWSLIIDGHDE